MLIFKYNKEEQIQHKKIHTIQQFASTLNYWKVNILKLFKTKKTKMIYIIRKQNTKSNMDLYI